MSLTRFFNWTILSCVCLWNTFDLKASWFFSWFTCVGLSHIIYFPLFPVSAWWTQSKQSSKQSGSTTLPGEQTWIWEKSFSYCRTKLEWFVTAAVLLSILIIIMYNLTLNRKATRNFKCHSSMNLHKNSFANKIKPSSLGEAKSLCISINVLFIAW